MPKSDPIADLATRLVQELTTCQAEGGDRYPVTLNGLTARLTPPPEPAAVLKAATNKTFTGRAVAAVKGRMDAPVALLGDLARLAASPLTLEVTLRVNGEKGAPPWTPAGLAKVVQKPLKMDFQENLIRQLESGELPAFAVQVGKGKAVKLHHRDRSPPPAPEVQDAERLLELLRRWERPGGAVPLVTPTDLERAAQLKSAAFKKAVKRPAFAGAVTQVKVKPTDVYLVPNGDEFVRFAYAALLPRLLDGCPRTKAHAFPVTELVAFLKDKAQQKAVAALLDRDDLARDLPAGVGCVRVSVGKDEGGNCFFRLEDLQAAKPAALVAAPGAAPAAHPPADFATAFDAAFVRLDHERGSNDFVSLVDLRAALPTVSREAFDAGLHELRRARRFVLSSDERYDGITPEERAAAVREEGEFLLHVSRGRQ